MRKGYVSREQATLAKISTMLFGDAIRPVNRRQLSPKVGISPATLCNWSHNPGTITLYGAVKIANALHMSDEDWCQLRKEG